MNEITQAFIFAAGRGERMRPITDTIPKPLVKINNKSIIDYTIEKLDKISSIKKIIINGFYLSEKIEEHLKNLNNPKIIFSKENKKIETGGGLVFARDKIDFNQPLLTINGDILWQEKNGISDIELLTKKYFSYPYSPKILMGLKKKNEFLGYEGKGDFNFDKTTSSLERSASSMDYVFVGPQIIDPKILNSAPQECFSMSHFYTAENIKNGTIKAVYLSGDYFHIGTVGAIGETEKVLWCSRG